MDDNIVGLQDEDAWGFNSAVRQRAQDGRRAIVAVGFTPADVAQVAEAAQLRSQSSVELIREAALDRARTQHGC